MMGVNTKIVVQALADLGRDTIIRYPEARGNVRSQEGSSVGNLRDINELQERGSEFKLRKLTFSHPLIFAYKKRGQKVASHLPLIHRPSPCTSVGCV